MPADTRGWPDRQDITELIEAGQLPELHSKWLHTKSGGRYIVGGWCVDEPTWEIHVLYFPEGQMNLLWEGQMNLLWCSRSAKEFMDGRFVSIDDAG